MPELRYKGMAPQNPTFPELLKSLCGYQAVRDGADWVVPASDPALVRGPQDILKLHGQVTLSKNNYSTAARRLASVVSRTFDEYYKDQSKRPRVIADEPSKLNKIYAYLIDLTFAQPKEIEGILREKIVPFMVEEMGAIAATPVTVEAERQQAYYSVAKFGLLLQRHDFQTVKDLVFHRRALNGILPGQLDPLAYVSALTRLAPWALTLPVERVDCVWHFQAEAMWEFRHIHTEGLFQQFLIKLSPTAKGPTILGLSGLDHMTEGNIWRYLRLVVEGVNRLLHFLNDPRNFINYKSGEVDFGIQLQAYGAVNLLFADITALNYSTSSYHRISCAMSALDKIANLKRHVGEISGDEGAIFRNFATACQAEKLEQMFEQRARASSPELAKALVNMVRSTYANIHQHYRDDMGITGQEEESRTRRLRHQRNLRHGTFLQKLQFDEMFGESKGTIPDDVVMLPFLLTLGLTFDPAVFLRHEPVHSAKQVAD